MFLGFMIARLLNPGAKLALARYASPAPEGPGSNGSVGRPALMLSGNPVRQLKMGYRLHPFTRRFGPDAQAWSKGKSHPPLKVSRCLTSKSDEPRNWPML